MMFNYHVKLPLSSSSFDRFLGLPPHPTKCQATYIWIDGTQNLRSKTRTLQKTPGKISDYPVWNFDGSSTGQATGSISDVHLQPVAYFPDPFLGGNNRLVMCETYDHFNRPTPTNFRNKCNEIMKRVAHEEPWFGFPSPQGPYYCSVGGDRAFGREVIEAHYRACLHAGLEISGTNAEVTPGQWEYQIGPCEGISMGDQLWVSRYLLHRTAEQFGVLITMDPKPPVMGVGDWNGAGCHTNFSTAKMRAEGGIEAIEASIPLLEKKHKMHLLQYDGNHGKDNERRLCGRLETSSAEVFTCGVADRACSVRIPQHVSTEGKGYLEDRRPASNCDPYRVTMCIASAVLLPGEEIDLMNGYHNGTTKNGH